MTYDINVFNLILLIFVSILQFCIIYKGTMTSIQKLTTVFLWFSVLMYCGITTIYVGVGDTYLIHYITFSSVMLLPMITIFRCRLIKKEVHIYKGSNRNSIKFYDEQDRARRTAFTKMIISNNFLYVCMVLYYLYYIVYILQTYGFSGFVDLHISLVGFFKRSADMYSTPLRDFLRLVMVIVSPFYFILLQRKKECGNTKFVIISILVSVYLQIAAVGYIARSDILTYLALILLIVFNKKSEEYKLQRNFVYTLTIGFIGCFPLMLAYESFRIGAEFHSQGLLNDIMALVIKETNYGKLFPNAVEYHKPFIWVNYFIWLITLPIPSAISGGLKNNIIIASSYFSQNYLGKTMGDYGYYILLPSFLGEGLLYYGNYFYWIHALVFGTIAALGCIFLEKNRELRLFNLNMAIQMLTIGRAGTVGYISSLVNGMIGYIIILYILKLIVVRRHN